MYAKHADSRTARTIALPGLTETIMRPSALCCAGWIVATPEYSCAASAANCSSRWLVAPEAVTVVRRLFLFLWLGKFLSFYAR